MFIVLPKMVIKQLVLVMVLQHTQIKVSISVTKQKEGSVTNMYYVWN